MAAEVVDDHHSARLQRRAQEGLSISQNGLAVDRPVQQGGSVEAVTAAAERGLASEEPTQSPPSQRRYIVLAQISSMKTRRLGSVRPS